MPEHVLNGREVMSIPRLPPCTEIECGDGAIWVTFTGDPEDYVVQRGQRLLVDWRRGAVISALGTSRFSVSHGQSCREGTLVMDLGVAAST